MEIQTDAIFATICFTLAMQEYNMQLTFTFMDRNLPPIKTIAVSYKQSSKNKYQIYKIEIIISIQKKKRKQLTL